MAFRSRRSCILVPDDEPADRRTARRSDSSVRGSRKGRAINFRRAIHAETGSAGGTKLCLPPLIIDGPGCASKAQVFLTLKTKSRKGKDASNSAIVVFPLFSPAARSLTVCSSPTDFPAAGRDVAACLARTIEAERFRAPAPAVVPAQRSRGAAAGGGVTRRCIWR